MIQYLLSEWEINGYSDSDFEGAVWDTEANSVKRIMLGTTRFAAPITYDGITVGDIPEDIIVKALSWLSDAIYHDMWHHEHNKIACPNDVRPGDRVVLQEDRRNHKKVSIETACHKCEGTGAWVNPHNTEDVRECFACDGKGVHISFEKAPKVDGKLQWDTFKAGDAGIVTWVGTFRQIWHNGGYNRRDRHTLSVRVLMDDGRLMNCMLDQLSLEHEPDSDNVLRERANSLALKCQFGKALNPRHAWDTRNYLREQLNGK